MGRGLVTSPTPSGPAVDQALQALHTSIPGATAIHDSMVQDPEVLEGLEGEAAPGHLVEGPALAGHQAWLLTFKEAGDGLDRLSVTPFGAASLNRTLPPPVDRVGETLGGRYLLQDLIATGGFGAVYLATDQRSSLQVIVKTMQPGYVDHATDLQRFFNEARLAARLKHPNTVRTLDFGHTEDGRLYIALERLVGSDLNGALGDELRISPGNTCDVGIGVLRSLAEAHDLGLVHRDLKPANIFVVNSAVGPDAIKVIDFGIAKDLSGRDPKLTQANMVVGTMQYMPPETLLGKTVDTRGDLYSLGLVLYRCLSGHVPFGSLDGFGPVLHRIEHPCPPLREACPDRSVIPSALGDCVMRAVERDPATRWSRAQEMLRELEAIRGQLG
jgi:serine/threonine-protein kinase